MKILKKITGFLLALLLLLPMAAAQSAPCEGEVIDSGHFTLRVPKDWLVVSQRDNGLTCYYVYAEMLRSRYGGYIFITEEDYTMMKSQIPSVYSEREVCEGFATGILDIPETTTGFSEHVVYNDVSCYVFTEEDEMTRWLVAYNDGYIVCAAFYLLSDVAPEDFFSTIQYK